jgi:hypothetical protein
MQDETVTTWFYKHTYINACIYTCRYCRVVEHRPVEEETVTTWSYIHTYIHKHMQVLQSRGAPTCGGRDSDNMVIHTYIHTYMQILQSGGAPACGGRDSDNMVIHTHIHAYIHTYIHAGIAERVSIDQLRARQ